MGNRASKEAEKQQIANAEEAVSALRAFGPDAEKELALFAQAGRQALGQVINQAYSSVAMSVETPELDTPGVVASAQTRRLQDKFHAQSPGPLTREELLRMGNEVLGSGQAGINNLAKKRKEGESAAVAAGLTDSLLETEGVAAPVATVGMRGSAKHAIVEATAAVNREISKQVDNIVAQIDMGTRQAQDFYGQARLTRLQRQDETIRKVTNIFASALKIGASFIK